MSQDPVALLVSKIDSNIALLMTPDRLTVIEYPVTLLPEGTKQGMTINIVVSRDEQAEQNRIQSFIKLQSEIGDLYGLNTVQ
ncbi:hypothetical protein MIR68_003548 [Amoeboaphelidium protococcarum]|nr:hypothetical protein MIR68_003548 [Amoeboaphelidium protococcarum]